ncbi:hypothetical protein [Fluviicola sp.]|jgi:hypothetical protein|uniref:hypothetical protein n=1 Tax=Fluviicola sp. TaxID=1917219 RepID=UPI002823D1BA|nr:hypothetical protein [Fluviicola sp.]MDR0801173.1 hypothetical protein [Fluviicola sp.]
MKKVNVTVIFAFVVVGMFGCKKNNIRQSDGKTPNSEAGDLINTNKVAGNYSYLEKQRDYRWVENNTKLDCSGEGTGCTVSSRYVSDDSEIDLSVIQVLDLMNIQETDLNRYFTENDLSYEFPSFYEDHFLSDLRYGNVIMTFGFPYLKITDKNGMLIKIYNYEFALSDDRVIAKMKEGGYTKKISVNTETGKGPWKCTETGDNCKVNAIRFDMDWLSHNPQYAYYPNSTNSTIEEISADKSNHKLLIKTTNGKQYGMEL